MVEPNLRTAQDTSHTWEPTSLYVHIPFCASRCHYCDFTTYVAPRDVMEGYVQNLLVDLAQMAEFTTRPLKTIFFGGGTPTLLSSDLLEVTFETVNRLYRLAPDVEWSVEANPGTVNPEKLALMRDYGVNRISYGAQTFDERLLMAIGRSHDVDTIVTSVESAKRAGFTRLNLDLMFGLPEQTLQDVRRSLQSVLDMDVQHISAYWLKVEPGTPFASWQSQGLLPLPGEDEEADMYDLVRDTLRSAGFRHYEVSNFAMPNAEARHNLVYWRNEPYLAAGVGAHGYVHGERFDNVKKLNEYAEKIQAQERPTRKTAIVSANEAMEDTMMLGLRLAEGVSRSRFYHRHHVHLEDQFQEAVDWGLHHGLLQWVGESLCLTDKAWPVANVVFERFVG